MRLALLAALLLTTVGALAARLAPEASYSDEWCAANAGRADQRVDDGTRPDCVTLAMAIEADFADKWYEAIGQASHYATVTGRLPGLLLIVEEPRQCVYVERTRAVLEHLRYRHALYGLVPYRLWLAGDPEMCRAGVAR